MKFNKYIILIIILIAGLVLSYFKFFKSDENNEPSTTLNEDDGHNHASDNQSTEKKVYLNSAQIKNSDITFGWYQLKNLNEVIHANGYTKLPPQNEAEVSVFTSGIINSINVIEGQAVKKGEVLARIDSPEAVKLHEAYLTSKSRLEYLKLEFERQSELKAAQVNAKKTFEKVESEYKIEKAKFNSLKTQLNYLNIDINKSSVNGVSILAPISGNITDVFVKIGSAVEMNKPLFSIVDNSEMHVDLLIYEKDLSRVKIGQPVRFVLTNQSNLEIKGTIFNIGKSFENETKTVAVHADIDQHEEDLIPGMYVNALIDAGSNKVSSLPETAIIDAEGRHFIFILEKEKLSKHQGHSHAPSDEKEFKRIEVKKGASQLGYVEVTALGKIYKGSKIVTSGAYYLQSHLQKSEGGGGHGHAH